MSRTTTSRLAMAAGIFYAIVGLISVRWPQPDSGWDSAGIALEAAFVAGLALTLPSLRLLAGSGRVAKAARTITALGFAGLLVSAAASLVAARDELGPVFMLGVVAALAGQLTLTVVAARRRPAGWWTAPAAFVGLLLAMAIGDQGGMVALGVAWVAIGLAYRAAEPLPIAGYATAAETEA